MKDDTLEPNALSIPANSTAMYPAPTTAVFLAVRKNKLSVIIHYYFCSFKLCLKEIPVKFFQVYYIFKSTGKTICLVRLPGQAAKIGGKKIHKFYLKISSLFFK